MAWSMRQSRILMKINLKKIKSNSRTVSMQEISLLASTAQVDIDRHPVETKTEIRTPVSWNHKANMPEVRRQWNESYVYFKALFIYISFKAMFISSWVWCSKQEFTCCSKWKCHTTFVFRHDVQDSGNERPKRLSTWMCWLYEWMMQYVSTLLETQISCDRHIKLFMHVLTRESKKKHNPYLGDAVKALLLVITIVIKYLFSVEETNGKRMTEWLRVIPIYKD